MTNSMDKYTEQISHDIPEDERVSVREALNDNKTMKLSDFRKRMKNLGYTVKAKTTSFSDLARGEKVFVTVYDGKKLINTSMMSKEHLDKYKQVFDILNNYKISK